jgi:hypothetical protein
MIPKLPEQSKYFKDGGKAGKDDVLFHNILLIKVSSAVGNEPIKTYPLFEQINFRSDAGKSGIIILSI